MNRPTHAFIIMKDNIQYSILIEFIDVDPDRVSISDETSKFLSSITTDAKDMFYGKLKTYYIKWVTTKIALYFRFKQKRDFVLNHFDVDETLVSAEYLFTFKYVGNNAD